MGKKKSSRKGPDRQVRYSLDWKLRAVKLYLEEGYTAPAVAEELGIEAIRTSPLLEVQHDYADKAVLLDVHVIHEFSGQARGLENQPLQWVLAESLRQYQFPAANEPIVEAVISLLVS